MLAVKRGGMIVWTCTAPRDREQSLASLLIATFAKRPGVFASAFSSSAFGRLS